MARDEQHEAPRRGRPKRTSANVHGPPSSMPVGVAAPPPPHQPNPKSRMEMMLAAVTTAEAAAAAHQYPAVPQSASVPQYAPPSQFQQAPPSQVYHSYQVYQPQQAYQQQPQQQQPESAYYHQQSQQQPPAQQQSSSSDKVKRKRVKKARNDISEWTAAPQSQVTPASTETHHNDMSIGSLMTAPHSISSLTTTMGGDHTAPPPPTFPMPVAASSGLHVRAPAAATSLSSILSSSPAGATSVFEATPTIIQSFAETERQRARATTATASSNMNIIMLTNSGNNYSNGKEASVNSNSHRSGKHDVERGAAVGTSGRSNSASHTQSVLELFFPDAAGAAAMTTSTTANGGSRDSTKSLKRKRRAVDSSSTSSSRSNRRVHEDTVLGANGRWEDMLRFGVDAAKLIPQGLVDRVDAKMSTAFISKLIRSHVANWIQKSGFGNNFVSEVTTLLTAYYPCNYPTILDEVVASFLFKRPEKFGESATGAKYPVVDAFARACCFDGAGGISELSRHSFACEILLQCLVERNTEKFILSSSIAACAVNCSDAVLEKLWREILEAWILDSDEFDVVKNRLPKHGAAHWNIVDPIQQAYELLHEEKLRLRGSSSTDAPDGGCRLSAAFVRVVLLDARFKDESVIVSSAIMQQALELFFGHGSVFESSALLLDRVRDLADDSGKEFAHLLRFLVNSTAKLSLKKTNWFVRHVLRFLLSDEHSMEGRHQLLLEVVAHYMPLLLGSAEDDELKSQGLSSKADEKTRKNPENGDASPKKVKTSKNLGATQLAWDLSHVEKHSVSNVLERLETLLDTLDTLHHNHVAMFFETWTAAWSSTSDKTGSVPWSYVYAIILAAVNESSESKYSTWLMKSFHQLVARTCRSYFSVLAASNGAAAVVIHRFTKILYLLLASPHEFAKSLLHDAVDALCSSKNESFSSGSVFKNAVMVHFGEQGARDEVWRRADSPMNGKQTAIIEDGAASSSAFTHSDAAFQVLASLSDLASRRDDTGKFVRVQLSCRQIVRLLSDLLHKFVTSRVKIQKLIDTIDAVVAKLDKSAVTKEWTRQHVVEQMIECAYRVETPRIMDRLAGLVHRITRTTDGTGHGRDATLLWGIVRQCTNVCCGCVRVNREPNAHRAKSAHFHLSVTGSFAELVKGMLLATPSAASDVGVFIEQQLWSCRSKDERMNLFLLVLLQKVAPVERPPRSYLTAIQLAVFSIGTTTQDHTRIMQLQLLKALCARVAALRHFDKNMVSKNVALTEECRACEELVCNPRLQSDLQRIVASSAITPGASGACTSSRVSIVLAEGILEFAAGIARRSKSHTRTTDR
ncbi:hypothetical protein FI667_g151, partial [Globisporangium splendens]